MQIVALLQEFPFPANGGMRSDVSRRLQAFHALGHEVHAISWTGGRLDPSVGAGEIADASAVTSSFQTLKIDRSIRRGLNLWRFPSQSAGRWPRNHEREDLLRKLALRKDEDRYIWIDGIFAAPLGFWLSERLGIPLLYRSHNIEHRYVAEQARLASGANRLSISTNLIGLRALERRLHSAARMVYDISSDDLQYWRNEGFTNNTWLPPQFDPAISETSGEVARDTDLLFIGTLTSPNNIVGLRWYLETVHPRVRAAIPDVSLMIAGRRPSRKLAELVAQSGAELIADPPEAAPIFARARVMLNPILHGSGVNIKTIDMLATGRPVVTTTKGARGLPTDVVAELSVADDPVPFADAVIAAIRDARAGTPSADRHELMERIFGTKAVARALAPLFATQTE
jgi:glycosyltransferase involved in cell wall biosynthesis